MIPNLSMSTPSYPFREGDECVAGIVRLLQRTLIASSSFSTFHFPLSPATSSWCPVLISELPSPLRLPPLPSNGIKVTGMRVNSYYAHWNCTKNTNKLKCAQHGEVGLNWPIIDSDKTYEIIGYCNMTSVSASWISTDLVILFSTT